MSSAKKTRDHAKIKKWIEERGGEPSMVRSESSQGGGILRVNFPGYSGDEVLEEVSWDEFFEEFDSSNLTFLYQDECSDGAESRFNKFIRDEGSADNQQSA